MWIGWDSHRTEWAWNGRIDDVLIYSYALNAKEIRTLYASRDRPDEASKRQAKLPRDHDAGE